MGCVKPRNNSHSASTLSPALHNSFFMLLLVAKVAQKPPHAPPSGAKSSALHHFGGAVLLLRCKCGPNWNYALRRVYDLTALTILNLNRPLRPSVTSPDSGEDEGEGGTSSDLRVG